MKRFFTMSTSTLTLYATSVEQQFARIPDWAKIFSIAISLANLVIGDILTPVLCLIAVASSVDWFFGRIVAKKKGTYQKDLSTYGWQLKLGVLLVIMMVRGFEEWFAALEILDTRGFVSTAIAVGIFIDELDSIDENFFELRGRRIPGLGRALEWMRSVQDRLMGDSDVNNTPQRRSTDA
jgi:small basic protein